METIAGDAPSGARGEAQHEAPPGRRGAMARHQALHSTLSLRKLHTSHWTVGFLVNSGFSGSREGCFWRISRGCGGPGRFSWGAYGWSASQLRSPESKCVATTVSTVRVRRKLLVLLKSHEGPPSKCCASFNVPSSLA